MTMNSVTQTMVPRKRSVGHDNRPEHHNDIELSSVKDDLMNRPDLHGCVLHKIGTDSSIKRKN